MAKGHRFQVVIEGIELDSATTDRVRLAVQRAALRELADIDYHGDVAARIGNGNGNGETQGITIVALTEGRHSALMISA